ncbi:MAG: hypothetical protein PHQ18_02210 [Patescibacteria group bacterium]|nr:hypothetical protein [Patescibacteria group bacterium]
MGSEELWGLALVFMVVYLFSLGFKTQGEYQKRDELAEKIYDFLKDKTEEQALNEWELSNITNGRIQKDDIPEALYWNIQSGRIFFRSMPDNYRTPGGTVVFNKYLFWGKEEKPDST